MAPVEEVTVLPLSVVASGHAAKGGNPILVCATEEDTAGSPSLLLKPFDEDEFRVYSRLADSYKDDPVHAYTPVFHGVTHSGGSKFISMGNLLQGFTNPQVMDVKIGTRTFQESEARSQKLRPDLFEKMVAQYPAHVTTGEMEAKAVTKHRWMDVHDRNSTTRSLGYRIDGAAGYRKKDKKTLAAELKRIHTQNDACEAFRILLEEVASEASKSTTSRIANGFLRELRRLRSVFESSEFLAQHECIGTSILLVADATGRTGAFWIDFAKTQPLSEGVRITHRKAWEEGNHEDGVLCGLDNMISAWSHVVHDLRGAAEARSDTTADFLSAGPIGCLENLFISELQADADLSKKSADAAVTSGAAIAVIEQEGSLYDHGYPAARKARCQCKMPVRVSPLLFAAVYAK